MAGDGVLATTGCDHIQTFGRIIFSRSLKKAASTNTNKGIDQVIEGNVDWDLLFAAFLLQLAQENEHVDVDSFEIMKVVQPATSSQPF